jgi:hypothetical protein
MEHHMNRTARVTGAGYLGLAVFGMLGFLVVRPQLYALGDAEATLANLQANPGLLQLGIALELLVVIAQAVAAAGFFGLFLRDRPTAGFAVAAFGMANAVVILGSAGLLSAALLVSADSAFAPGGDAAATVQLLYGLSAVAWKVGGIFFGLWLIPMGWFAISTRLFPRVLGILLLAGGVGYVIGSIVGAAMPQAPSPLVDVLTIPATVGELWMVGYLLVRGIRSGSAAA